MTLACETANSKLVEVDAEKRVDNSWVLNFDHKLIEILKLGLVKILEFKFIKMLMFGTDFEVDASSSRL